jgi:linearmycin/streptolysin S transport system ATP-binding protein
MNSTEHPPELAPELAPLLEAIEISRSYGSRLAVDHISLAVHAGEVVGLLGPNGAGKTTTLSILSTLLLPDSGRVLIEGQPPGAKSRHGGQMLGLVPQSLALYPTLSAAQNIWHFARMQGLSRADAAPACARALDQTGLAGRAHDPVRSFSGGMLRRLNLACGMVHRPSVLLFDEATAGVDPQSRERILALVRQAADDGAAVIYSTHYMEEAERICDRILLIDRGKLIAGGSVDEVIALGGSRPRMNLTCRGVLPANWCGAVAGVREIERASGGGAITLEMASLAQASDVLALVPTYGARVLEFSLHSSNLADAFIALTGRSLRDSGREAD